MSGLDAEAAGAIDDITATDALILDRLADGRNVPANIADEIERHNKHVSDRLSTLRDAGLVRQIGRENVSLHEITERGRHVLQTYQKFQSALNA